MDAKTLYAMAISSRNKGNKKAAYKFFTKIINEYPNSTEAEDAKKIIYDLKESINVDGTDSTPPTETVNSNTSSQNVIITDIQMPFGSMVVFIVKWVIASIPAMIILAVLFMVVTKIFGGIL